MQRRAFIQNVTIIVLGVLIIIMSVGYATFAVPLNISGTTSIDRAKWEVKFDNIKTLSTTTVQDASITAPTLTDTTNLTFGVKLAINSLYEFTVDAVNTGTIPAKLSTFKLSATKNSESVLDNSNSLSYVDDNVTYQVTYEDGTELGEGDELGVGESVTLKVSVSNPKTIDYTNLPTTDLVYVFSLDLNYAQAN